MHGTDPAAQYKWPAWMYNAYKQAICTVPRHVGKSSILRYVG